jgi:hypothetical protein
VCRKCKGGGICIHSEYHTHVALLQETTSAKSFLICHTSSEREADMYSLQWIFNMLSWKTGASLKRTCQGIVNVSENYNENTYSLEISMRCLPI